MKAEFKAKFGAKSAAMRGTLGALAAALTGMAALTGAVVLGPNGSAGASEGSRLDPDLPAPAVEMSISRQPEDPGKAVNLTLDDGPDPTWTPKALEILAASGAKATFCMTGPNAQAHPDLVKKVVAAGHRLCNHSVSHDTAMDRKSVAYQGKEILDAKRMIDEASGGAELRYYRAPGGAFTPQSRQLAAAHGMRSLGWNVDPGDYRRPGADTILATVERQLANGPTILLHDGGGDRSQTMQALQNLLPRLKEQGYAFSFPQA
ncbi:MULTISPECIES: polysaccharide deacetylase family protein [Streptomyces]|nr:MULTISPECIES: polysaccharide deacetylase family protein [Streptomyces]MCC2279857.1 polysaccharide deacetylase family protein [Streptomyces sp. ET3-23]GHF46891.1 hydrolase [Streptomyces morookaense]